MTDFHTPVFLVAKDFPKTFPIGPIPWEKHPFPPAAFGNEVTHLEALGLWPSVHHGR